jgi:hypothetical protein
MAANNQKITTFLMITGQVEEAIRRILAVESCPKIKSRGKAPAFYPIQIKFRI